MCQQTQAGECLICANCNLPIVGDVFYFFGQPMDGGCCASLEGEYDDQFADVDDFDNGEEWEDDEDFVDYDGEVFEEFDCDEDGNYEPNEYYYYE